MYRDVNKEKKEMWYKEGRKERENHELMRENTKNKMEN